ncbi:MAG: primase-like protein [Herbinix sp.]|jgi:DNA primase|nr:primase-like protein [Herbinix sp.]
MNKKEWYEQTIEFITNDLEDFYQHFYKNDEKGFKLVSIGSGYRLNPCPVCGHNDCATVGEAVNCFSCHWSGTHISAWYEYATGVLGIPLRDAIAKLDIFTGLRFPNSAGSNIEDYAQEIARQNILRVAEKHYHEQLIKCTQTFNVGTRWVTPLDYLLKIRQRKMTTIEDMKIGFISNYFDLHKLLISMGYTKQQIKDAKAWAPEGLFIYYYKDPLTKDITRINTKNPFQAKIQKKDDSGSTIEGDVIQGYSVGDKVPMFTPRFSFKKPFVAVEGENDLGAIYENGATNSSCIGGNLSDEQFEAAFENAENIIYVMFDNDEKGNEYVDRMNRLLPDKDIRKIEYPLNFNDPDDYYRSPEAKHIDILIKDAKRLETEGYKISHIGNAWTIANRHRKVEFIIDMHSSDKGQMVGTVNLFSDGILIDREVDKDLTKCKANKKPFNFYLHDKINEHFNSGLGEKSADELADIYWCSAKKQEIVRRLAKILFDSNNDDKIVNMLKIKLKTSDGREDVIDAILKEANDVQNKLVGAYVGSNIPKIKVSQYFNIGNNDGYFYFMNYKQDGDSLRRLPFLLRNDKTLIRLDLLKRKDPQCLLLVDNKYELPVEINEAIMDSDECSLTQANVYKYIDGQIPLEELDPKNLADVLTEYFEKFYYSTDSSVYKILSLYTILTYYYELFDSIPYLYINGQKGSGKSVIGSGLHLFCFNAKMATDISDASLFRMTSLEGGTLILDEMEQLTSRKKGSESTMGIVLKGGYKRASNVYRADVETTLKTNRYDSYGPKVIINIFGLDDVIKDRCIQINTFRYKLTRETKREDPKSYLNRLGGIRDLTSKLCLSALEHFQEVNKIKQSCFFETNNDKARLSEILTPILVMAKFVDAKERKAMTEKDLSLTNGDCIGSYEKAVQDFYINVIKGDKEDTDRNTPEGIITACIPQIAKELYGIIPDPEKVYTIPTSHKYTEPIKYSVEEGWFDVNVIHLKCFVEEHQPGETAHTKIVVRWLKTCFDIPYKDIKRSIANIENEDLIREFKGNAKPKINTYRFYFRDFIDSIGEQFLDKTPRSKAPEKKVTLF